MARKILLLSKKNGGLLVYDKLEPDIKAVVEGTMNKPKPLCFGWVLFTALMNGIFLPDPPPNVDFFAPKFCFCGKKTVESHEFWYCSTECARQDALRSLDDPECHYRKGVRKAYIRAGIPDLYPRRMMSVGQLRSHPPQYPGVSDARPHIPLPKKSPISRQDGQDRNSPGFPTLSQVAGRVLTKKASAGEQLIPARHGHSRLEDATSRLPRPQMSGDHEFKQICLDAIPLPEPAPGRTLRRVPQSTDGLRNNIRKSVVALWNAGKSQKEGSPKSPERVFGHDVNTIVPPVRKESLPANRQMKSSAARSRDLRRSRSFAGWGPSNEEDPVMHIIEEMREELAESFDPRSFFSQEESY